MKKITYNNLFLLTLLCTGCLGVNIVQKNILFYIIIALLLFFTYKAFKIKSTSRKIFLYYAVFLFISFVVSNKICGQNLRMLAIVSTDYIALLFYFILLYFKVSEETVKKLLYSLSIIICVAYIVQWLIYPRILFSAAASSYDIVDNEKFRMRFHCSMCFYLLFFWSINKAILSGKYKNFIIALLASFPIVMMGFRSLITLTILSLFIMPIYVSGRFIKYIKTIIILSAAIFVAIQTPFVQYKLEEMLNRNQQEQTFSNDDYVRNVALVYYEGMSSDNLIKRFFGGGRPLLVSKGDNYYTPMNPSNSYQKSFATAYDMSLFWNDLGLIGLSYIIGIPAVIILIIMCLKGIKYCKDPDIQFIRFTLITVLVGSVITTEELYRSGNFVILSILIYLIDCRRERNQTATID